MARVNAQEHNMTQEPTTETEPYYVVIEGTNIRDTLHGRYTCTPKVYDSEQIALNAINESIRYRTKVGLHQRAPRTPISAADYDAKYGVYQSAAKE